MYKGANGGQNLPEKCLITGKTVTASYQKNRALTAIYRKNYDGNFRCFCTNILAFFSTDIEVK